MDRIPRGMTRVALNKVGMTPAVRPADASRHDVGAGRGMAPDKAAWLLAVRA